MAGSGASAETVPCLSTQTALAKVLFWGGEELTKAPGF